MSVTFPRILFFIAGGNPSLEEQLAAEQLAPCRVGFRNASYIDKGTALEACDGVIGDATPKAYKKKYPTAEAAIEKYKAERVKEYNAKAALAKASREAVADDNVAKADKGVEIAAVALKKAADEKAVKDATAKKAKAAVVAAKKDAKGADKVTPSATTKAAEGAGNAWKSNA